MLSAIDRNHCPPSNGMSVRHHRNTHGAQRIICDLRYSPRSVQLPARHLADIKMLFSCIKEFSDKMMSSDDVWEMEGIGLGLASETNYQRYRLEHYLATSSE